MLGSIVRHAHCLSRMGRRDEQIGLLRQLRDDRRFTRTKDREGALAELAYALREAEQYAEAADLFRQLQHLAEDQYGTAHLAAILAQFDLASCVGLLGDPAEAVRMLDAVVRLQGSTGDGTGFVPVLLRRRLCTWTGMAGDPHAAARGLHDLARTSETAVGQHAYLTLGCRSRAAHWTAAAGDVPYGIEELTRLLPELDRRFGPGTPEARDSRESLAHWRALVRHSLPPTG
ncbi:hypothetical protein OK074_1503 [Actinobacteria bacterium OK074]|nr:hypothetical protein OK074_1503 [Actinobacteria bacterium OK074]